MKLVEQEWRPNVITFTKETWDGLHTGKHPHWIVQDGFGNVIAIVYDPTDSDKDSLYTAAIATLPRLIRLVNVLFIQETISEKEKKELRHLIQTIKTV